MYVVNSGLALRVERAEAVAFESMLQKMRMLPDNPYDIESRRFGRTFALTARGVPWATLSNRVVCAGPDDDDHLEEALSFLESQIARARIDVVPTHQNPAFMNKLWERGYRCEGFQMAMFGEPKPDLPAPAAGVTVEAVHAPDTAETAARIFAEGFGMQPERAPYVEDQVRAVIGQPGWTVYLARVDGQPAAVGILHVSEGTASLHGACTLKEYRVRGAQTALLHRRIADAAEAGCDLVVSQTGNGTASQNNMERVGLRIAFTKAEFFRVVQASGSGSREASPRPRP